LSRPPPKPSSAPRLGIILPVGCAASASPSRSCSKLHIDPGVGEWRFGREESRVGREESWVGREESWVGKEEPAL
jgi:hypothetical protein